MLADSPALLHSLSGAECMLCCDALCAPLHGCQPVTAPQPGPTVNQPLVPPVFSFVVA